MYDSFFHLCERPFSPAPTTCRYYPGGAMEDARVRLSRCIERAEGPGLLIGAAGTGKSLLCHVLHEKYEQELAIAHLSSGRLCSRRTLIQAILYELGMPYRNMDEGELRLSLIDRLASNDTPQPGMLLLVDEAHTLPVQLLEEIRMITNLVRGGQPRVRLVMAGAPVLEERFASPKLECFNQRVAARCYLDAFDHKDTLAYIRSQITASEGDPEAIFSSDALEAVYRASGGVPRLINQICDHALILASAGGVRELTASGIDEAWADLQQLPTPWTAPGSSLSGTDSGVIEFGALEEELPPSPDRDDPTVASTPNEGILDEHAGHEFEPTSTSGPEIELTVSQSDPFGEVYDDEELVIDQYANSDEEVLRSQRQVIGPEGFALPEQMRQATQADSCADASLDSCVSKGENEPLQSGAGDVTTCDVRTCDLDANLAPQDDPVLPGEEVIQSGTELNERRTSDCEGSAIAIMPDPTSISGSDDLHDLIIVEDEPMEESPSARPVRRQAYGQLFSKLRRG